MVSLTVDPGQHECSEIWLVPELRPGMELVLEMVYFVRVAYNLCVCSLQRDFSCRAHISLIY